VKLAMSLELLNTVATLATCVIIATTAIVALVQLRHLRASNQIQGQLAINALIQSDQFWDAQMKIEGLSAMLNDPTFAWAFRQRLSEELPPEVVAMRRAARVVGSNLENIGNMIRNGLTEKGLFIEQFGNVVSEAWNLLEPYARVRRQLEENDAVWEDFEYLTMLSREWMETQGSVFPAQRRRILPPWNEMELPAASEVKH